MLCIIINSSYDHRMLLWYLNPQLPYGLGPISYIYSAIVEASPQLIGKYVHCVETDAIEKIFE